MELNPRWDENEGKLEATVTTSDFLAAVTLISEVAAVAEEQNHHPDIAIHDYSKVTISLISHDAGEVTDKDYKLASAIDDLLENDEFGLL